jgi:hypothetical protein
MVWVLPQSTVAGFVGSSVAASVVAEMAIAGLVAVMVAARPLPLVLVGALAFALAPALALDVTLALAFALVTLAVLALTLVAGTQVWLPFEASFWPLLQGTDPLANEAMDMAQAAAKNKARNLLFFKGRFLPTLFEFKAQPKGRRDVLSGLVARHRRLKIRDTRT